jgi:Holliday junction resolvase RusA-like endonuclease
MAGGYPGHSAAYFAAVAQRGPAIDAVREKLAAAAPLPAPTMPPVSFTVAGEPVAWARTRIGPRGVLFNPKTQRTNAGILRMHAQAAMEGRALFDCAVRLDLSAEFSVPASWSKKRQAAAIAGSIRPAKKPDLSNCIKQLEDALNGVVVRDDCLIVEIVARKIYSASPRLVVTVSEIERPAMSRAASLFAASELPLGFAR